MDTNLLLCTRQRKPDGTRRMASLSDSNPGTEEGGGGEDVSDSNPGSPGGDEGKSAAYIYRQVHKICRCWLLAWLAEK